MDSLFVGQWQILERVAQGAPQADVLDRIVRLIEREVPGMLCSILLFDPVQQTLRHGAAPSLPPDYLATIDGAAIGPEAGSCGAAAFYRQPVIAEDTRVHPNWAAWREQAVRHGLLACWSTPIFSPDAHLLGTFAMYYREPRRPSERDLACIATATNLASISVTLERQAQLQEQLLRSQRMEAVGKLAAGVAHDFNNLLTVIMGYSAMLGDSLAVDDPLHHDAEEISRAAGRASELTRQLLAFGRQQLMQPRVVDLSRVLPTLERMLRRVVGAEVELSVVVAAGSCKVRVDPGQLEQVVLNLVVNARDAMPHGGRISIVSENVEIDAAYARLHSGMTPGSHVRVSVSDTGEGMDATTRARVFEPFFTTKEQGKGTGLGLSTVWGIVTQSGGHISVQSAAGAGSTFEVYLPCVTLEAEEAESEPLAPAILTGTETVLVVEDEDQVRSLLGSVLRRAGYEVLEARDGSEARVMLGTHPRVVHLLVADVVLPRMSGRELAEQLQHTRPGLKVLYVSGYAESVMHRHGMPLGETAFLPKPVTPQTLLRKAREVLDG